MTVAAAGADGALGGEPGPLCAEQAGRVAPSADTPSEVGSVRTGTPIAEFATVVHDFPQCFTVGLRAIRPRRYGYRNQRPGKSCYHRTYQDT